MVKAPGDVKDQRVYKCAWINLSSIYYDFKSAFTLIIITGAGTFWEC